MRRVVAEDITGISVAARLGKRIDRAACHPAILGGEASGHRVDFLDEFDWCLLSLQAAAEACRI